MAFRRFAHQNYAASPTASPSNPSTPRTRPPVLTAYRSPASTSSISASVPFDWDAARSRKPPPYSTPLQNRTRKSFGTAKSGQTRKGVVRKKSLMERITSIPSAVAFQIALFPHNLPLPSPKASARIIGTIMHFLHFCIRVTQIRGVPDSDLGWEDMYREGDNSSWLDWTMPVSTFLFIAAFSNAVYLFSRIRTYHLHHQPEPLSSPNAKFVSTKLDLESEVPPSLAKRITLSIWYAFAYFWRFLLGMQPPAPLTSLSGKTTRVQELQVWNPGELELSLFSIYSPVHGFLWMALNSSNWILMTAIMVLIWFQLNTMTRAFTLLVKDREHIAAEVLNEYNQGFVYPRLYPVRKDAAVMTHQSEMIDLWED
ncbi:hypothetical protein AMATHDRAFT_135569 [Amanita thiersii Skay4041]|uniref:Nuclear rim protein 1 n=1 Tax=Amanita thiersii Skay4041 TaxID=703135 RepID=A0A2A9P080_9AGAR|nr:hypothetical protein AMATHDRAFT_135569 [Amanita thiersii Skay4041]